MFRLKEVHSALLLMDLWPFPSCKTVEDALQIVSSQYRRLALNLHPDFKGGTQTNMAELNLALELIKEQVTLFPTDFFSFIKAEEPLSSKESSFDLYKEASREFTESLNLYFKDNDRVILDDQSDSYISLVLQLKGIRKKLLASIQKDPASPFNADAKEKIRRINIWLR